MLKSVMNLDDNNVGTAWAFFKLHEHEFVPTWWQRVKRLFWQKTDVKNINTDARAVGYEPDTSDLL